MRERAVDPGCFVTTAENQVVYFETVGYLFTAKHAGKGVNEVSAGAKEECEVSIEGVWMKAEVEAFEGRHLTVEESQEVYRR